MSKQQIESDILGTWILDSRNPTSNGNIPCPLTDTVFNSVEFFNNGTLTKDAVDIATRSLTLDYKISQYPSNNNFYLDIPDKYRLNTTTNDYHNGVTYRYEILELTPNIMKLKQHNNNIDIELKRPETEQE